MDNKQGTSIIIIKLARFMTKNDKEELIKDLRAQEKITARNDPWDTSKRLLVDNINESEIDVVCSKLLTYPGVSNIQLFNPSFFGLKVKTLGELISVTRDFLHLQQKKECFLQFRALNSVPFHKRAIRERLQKKGISIVKHFPEFNTTTTFPCYIEAKLVDNNILVRIGKSVAYQRSLTKDNPFPIEIQLVLYSPYTTQEIADFFRLSMVFGCEIILSNENGKISGLLRETKATLYKGMDKIKYQTIASLKGFISENLKETEFIGFSSWSRQGESEFFQFLKNFLLQNHLDQNKQLKQKRLTMVFGNEKGGLHYQIQKSIPIFKLGAGSEPLRATQVAAFALASIKALDWKKTPKIKI